MNILIVNQSVIDMCASFVMLLTAVVEVDGTRMLPDSSYHQFICLIWLTRLPLWALMATSTYGILMIAFERYFAVIYPLWYNVRIKDISKTLHVFDMSYIFVPFLFLYVK